MAQRKSAPASKSASRPTAAKKAAGARPAGTSRPSQTRTAPGTSAGRPGGARPPARKPGKSIVNQKQTPWGLIAATVAVVVFAAAIVIVVIATHKSGSDSPKNATHGGQAVNKNNTYTQPELPAAAAIKGVTYRVEAQHTHVEGTIKYDASPPVGGNHDQYWANCTGTVYSKQIANENAVHMLEHGAVWITYNPDKIKGAALTKLKTYVQGIDRMALSPYAGLKTPISMQAWGYQLFLQSPTDPRIAQFIKALKFNPKTTPENASCSDPLFKASESTPGHPFEGPSQ
jgi:hypothetical protein